MKIASGLIIRPEPLEKILSGRKTWEMRCGPIHKRETIALILKGSKAIYGVADTSRRMSCKPIWMSGWRTTTASARTR